MRNQTISAAVIGMAMCTGFATLSHAVAQPSPIMLADKKPMGDPVEISKLPKAVVDAVKKELPGAKLTKAIKTTDGNYWLTDVKVGKKEYNVTVSPEGKILKREDDND